MDAPQRTVATLDTLSTAQVAAIRRIPPHDQNNAPPRVDTTRPASIFTDPAYFDREMATVFKKNPVIVTLSALIPEPGTFLAHDGYGVPLLISRDKAGKVRVFLNVCQHKGSKLLEKCEPVKANLVMCPYHAWSYGADGALVGLPRVEVFPSIDKKTRGLVELHSLEAGGFVWVMLDKDAEPNFSGVTDELVDDMTALGIPRMHFYDRRSFSLDANWKLVNEPFLEGYHVTRLHAQTLGGLFVDVPNVIDRLGPHIRQISGRAEFTPELLDAPGQNIHKIVTHAYTLFPNTVVITSPYFISVMVMMPRAVDKTQVELFMITPTTWENEKAKDLFERSFALTCKVFGTEDFRAAQISQEGLESGGLKELVYGGLETSIPMFYETVESFL